MQKTAFLFSGQGSQYPGMAKFFYENFPSCQDVFQISDKIFDFDLADICFNADKATLAKTIYSQPAIFATSMCAYLAAKENGITATAVAGHSLGEYAAMVAADVITLEEGFWLIKARSEAMNKASESSDGAMCAVIGMNATDIEKICEETEGYVVPVNYNSTAQTVIAGERAAVDRAIDVFTANKARTIKLNVSSAFHSKLMQGAADDYKASLDTLEINFKTPLKELYSNLTGSTVTDISDLKENLVKHIVSPVKFTDELNLLYKNNYTQFVELGPNKVLTGLVKKTLEGVTAVNIEDEKSLYTAKEKLEL